MKKQLITFISDFGSYDSSIASLKNALLNSIENCFFIDITHQLLLPKQNHATYLAHTTLPKFSANSIHIILFDFYNENTKQLYLVSVDNYFVICTNIIQINTAFENYNWIQIIDENVSGKSYLQSIITSIHTLINNNFKKDEQANFITQLPNQLSYNVSQTGAVVFGNIWFIDANFNIITNIKPSHIQNQFDNIEINFGVKQIVNRISDSLMDATDGQIVAYFNENNFLELAMKNNQIARLFNIAINSKVTINLSK